MSGRRGSGMTGFHPWTRLAGVVASVRRRAREREALAMMEDRDLRELGVSRATLAFELNKPFWRG